MNKSNRKLRMILASIFGNHCMFKKSNAESFIEKLGTIKTYKQFKKETHYRSKKIKRLEHIKTLHHFQHISENGQNIEENVAIINELAHRYLHSLPREQEEIINNYIRKWKKTNYQKCDIIIEECPEPDFEINLAEIEISDKLNIRKYNRNEIKKQTQEAYNEFYEEM